MNKGRQNKAITVWLDHCRLKTVWHLWRLTRREGHCLKRVHYFGECGRAAQCLLKTWSFFHEGFSLQKFPFDLYVHNHGTQESLFWEIWRDRFHLGWEAGRAAELERLTKELAPAYDSFSLELYLRRQVAYEQMRPLGLIRLADWNIKKYRLISETHVILWDDSVWEQSLKDYAAKYGLLFYAFSGKNYYRWGIIRLVYAFFKILKFYGHYIFSYFFSQGPKSAAEIFSPKIGVFYAQGGDLLKRSDLYWLPSSGINPRDVLVYFMSPHYIPTKERIASLENLGVQWLSLLPCKFNAGFHHSQRLRRYTISYVRRLGLALKGMGLLLKRVRTMSSPSRWWQYEKLVWLLDRIAQFEALFVSQNIKVHFGLFSEDDQNMMALHMAGDRVKTVDVYVHWSNHPEIQLLPGHDVYFCWGPYFQKFFDPIGHGIRRVFFSGYPFDYTFEAVAAEARSARRQLAAHGVRFVLSFFDNSYHSGWGWFSRESIIEFYQALVQRVLQHPGWGLIIKPKREKSFADSLSPMVHALIEKLVKEGRCLILDFKKFPSMAAQASDLAIGFGVFNTPSIETSLAKVKTITYDPSHQRAHPFYKTGYNKIVFDDLKIMLEAIEQFTIDKDVLNGFGDFSSYLPAIDPFRDGKSALRIGEGIKNLFEALAGGKNKEEALQTAARLYREKYGIENVVEYSQNDFEAFLKWKDVKSQDFNTDFISACPIAF